MNASTYEEQLKLSLEHWSKAMRKKPSLSARGTRYLQQKWNNLLPERLHKAITLVMEKMVKTVLFGSKYLSAKPGASGSLEERDKKAEKIIARYKGLASAEGAVAGTGGILMGLAEFPVLLSTKIKMLFDLAATYGADVKDYKERVFILHIFQLAFSGQQHRREVFELIADWDRYSRQLPPEALELDWRKFQQEYRDYLDLAKLAQLLPFIGAAVGYVVNKRLVAKLGEYAMNSYRMRRIGQPDQKENLPGPGSV